MILSGWAFAQASPSAVPQGAAAAVDETSLAIGDDAVDAAGRPAARPSALWDALRMVAVLAAVALAIYGAVYLLKKVSRPVEKIDPRLKVLAGAHLGSNRFVHVVSLGSKAWLVGASDGGVGLIAEIDDKETIDAMLLDESRRASEAGRADFAALMKKLLPGAAGTPASRPSAGSVRERRERLGGL